MIIVDTALAERCRGGDPIPVALVGAGYSASVVAYQILTAFPGIRLVAIANRTLDPAHAAYARAGVRDRVVVTTPTQMERALAQGQAAVTSDPSILTETPGIEAIIESTGTIEYGARVALSAVQHGKHVVLLNAELDATLGPVLKAHADRAGVIITNTDGDEPGVAMNMSRFVRSIGLTPVVAGNLKGLYDPYRTPKTQAAFAAQHHQKATTMTSFADGTKLSMELTVLANALGFGVAKRGMHGPSLEHVDASAEFFRDKLLEGGMVDFLVGARPGNGAFVVGFSEDPVRRDYLKYLKMGDGPLYVFYTPFHLPQLEVPLTVARAVLLNDATATPKGPPTCDSVAIAKRDLKAGETLDGLGGFTCYALVDNFETSREDGALPMGVSEGCRLIRNVPKDELIRYDDVELPEGRLCDALRAELETLTPTGT